MKFELQPAHPRAPSWALVLLFLAAALAVALLWASCTGTGSPCWDEDGCPAGWACVERKCEAKPRPVPGPGGPL